MNVDSPALSPEPFGRCPGFTGPARPLSFILVPPSFPGALNSPRSSSLTNSTQPPGHVLQRRPPRFAQVLGQAFFEHPGPVWPKREGEDMGPVPSGTARAEGPGGLPDLSLPGHEERGKGFPLEAALAAQAAGGLSGMREGAEPVRGRLTVESTPCRAGGSCGWHRSRYGLSSRSWGWQVPGEPGFPGGDAGEHGGLRSHRPTGLDPVLVSVGARHGEVARCARIGPFGIKIQGSPAAHSNRTLPATAWPRTPPIWSWRAPSLRRSPRCAPAIRDSFTLPTQRGLDTREGG